MGHLASEEDRSGMKHHIPEGKSDLLACAETFGTPLYVYDTQVINERIRMLLDSLHPSVRLMYSLKANPNPTLVSHIHRQGLGLEICSAGELETALAAGATPDQMMYVGPGKSLGELERILDIGIHYIIVESLQELQILERLAVERELRVGVGLRFNPQTAIHGARLKMGGTARQFGIDETQLDEAVTMIALSEHLRLSGIHAYYGTRILSAQTLAANLSYVLDFAERFMVAHALELDYVGVGGGFGVPYYENEQPLDLKEFRSRTYGLIDAFRSRYPVIELLAESGRFLMAEAGSYLSSVRYTKESQGKQFAITDGGTNHHAAAGGAGSLLRRHFPVYAWARNMAADEVPVTITGPLCTPADLLAEDVMLPPLQPGDVIAVLNSGAYGLTMSPVLFLSHGIPREVLLHEGDAILIRDRDEWSLPRIRLLPHREVRTCVPDEDGQEHTSE